jgi:subtilisin family serine protease
MLAQPRYWVEFTDKSESAHLSPTQLLSPRAWQRRVRQGIPPDHRDYPVSPGYLAHLTHLGIEWRVASRWFNAVSAPLTAAQQAQVLSLPFVRGIRPIRQYQQPAEVVETCPDSATRNGYLRQIEMIDLDLLHRNQLTGQGVLVAVFDNGFENVNQLPGFDHLFAQNRILGTRDYVDGDEDVYHGCSHCRHGTYVFSILAAVMPGQLIGAAPGASYLLLRTENDDSETPQEEDNWVAAAEYADSMGADIFTTSLGYRDFDGQADDYHRNDLDGNTATITRAGDLAASRGIVVINSAGNAGATGLNAPADGDSILAIGAVDNCEAYASFSSQGPTADGRIKPDISAMGRGNHYLHSDGTLRRGNGTSFSCPLVTGLAACLIQAYPGVSNVDLYRVLRESATQAEAPDNLLGYGIPRGIDAWERLQTEFPQLAANPDLETEVTRYDPFGPSSLAIFPNPTSGQVYLSFSVALNVATLRLEWVDLMGRRLSQQVVDFADMGNPYRLPAPRSAGVYVLRLLNHSNDDLMFMRKVIIR